MGIRRVSITEDQMFKHVFGGDAGLCRRLIELSLGQSIAKVEFVQSQAESKEVGRSGGTYFDVLATTEQGELVDVEMQADSRPGLLQRARLYEGRLTKEVWTRYVEAEGSYDFSKMPRVAVIFVCDFDPFHAGLRRYTGRMTYAGAEDARDGAEVVFLNARGRGDDLPRDLAAFLEYVASGRLAPGRSDFVDEVARRVEAASDDAEFQEGLMNMDEKLWWSRQDGIEEGEKAGRAEGEKAGREERDRQIARLVECMVADGRQDNLPNVLTDPVRLAHELDRYGIGDEKG